MNDPLVSIVIPTYNRADFLPRTLSSAISQTYRNIEIVVCDNASTDQSSDVVADFKGRHPDRNIRYIRHGTNIGPVRNWFSGIHESRGEFIKILFSDDYLYPNSVKSLLLPIENTDYAFSYGKVHNLWEGSKGIKVTNFGRQRPGNLVRAKDYIAGFFSANQAFEDYPVSPCAALMRAEVLKKIPLEKFTDSVGIDVVASGIGPDMLMFLYSFLLVGDRAYYVDEHVAVFEGHKESITVTSTLDKLDDHNFSAVVKFYTMLPEQCQIKEVLEQQFDALATQPSFFRRPKDRLEIMNNGCRYIPKPCKPDFPTIGIALSFYRRCSRAAEFRFGQIKVVLLHLFLRRNERTSREESSSLGALK